MCRSKLGKPNAISIEDLNARKEGNTFEGDILIVYIAILDRDNKTREVLRANLTDYKGEMTITLNVTGNLVQEYKNKIVPRTSIIVSGFQIGHKTTYDHRDFDCILMLQDSSTIETIPRLCEEYKFIPSTTIKQLLTSTSTYAIGTIGALLVAGRHTGSQYVVDIKDGNNDDDKVKVKRTLNTPSFYATCIVVMFLLSTKF